LFYRHRPLALLPGHACILPIKHVDASTSLDEDVAQEVERMKEGLRKMWASKGKNQGGREGGREGRGVVLA